IRIDADVIAWAKKEGKGYQTRINTYLREAMHRAKKQPQPGNIRKKRSAS
ncbi:MAG TPA: BrnA antitoxin family protein, partial [Candidatus Angelobacter sp.]|nr:BrnA antitoxin family protein [Candidatus Angelobacter sp.]